MVKKIATLDPAGWVMAVSDKVDRAMSYFYLSQHSQTALYEDVEPLAYLVQQHGHSASAMRSNLESGVQRLLERQFEEAVVTVTLDDTTEESDRINLQLYAMVRDEATEYSLGHLIITANSKVKDIIDINNTGSIVSRNANLFTG